ncbi:hypothetical protein ACMC56_05580 [Campylobacterota bacterium DY0563]
MDTQRLLKKIIALEHKNYKKDKGQFLSYKGEESESLKYLKENIIKMLNETRKIGFLMPTFYDMSSSLRRNLIFDILYLQDREAFLKKLRESAYYGYLAICLNSKIHRFELMESIGEILTATQLCGWWNKADKICDEMIIAIGGTYKAGTDSKFIGNGDSYKYSVWFLLDLYCLANNKSYDKEKANLPDDYTPYDEVLKHWDTKDLKKVDQLVYILCEIHIIRAEYLSNYKQLSQEFSENWDALFPSEILCWLALREKQGLENPSEYSHEFMKEPLAKECLNLQTPLSYPIIPNCKELFDLYNKEYPEENAMSFYEEYKKDLENE